MDFSDHLARAKLTVLDTLSGIYARFQYMSQGSFEHCLKQYLDALFGTKWEELFRDLCHLQITPATITLVLLTVPMVLIATRLVPNKDSFASTSRRKSKSKKKKQTKAQMANREIQRILDFVEETYVPQIDSYIENYAALSEEEQLFKYRCFEEMLLKELMNLDNLDVVGNEVLRDNRKKVIRFIQDHQKRLDVFKRST